MNRPSVFSYERPVPHRARVIRALWLPIISGLFLWLTFPSISLSLLAWVALIPWLFAISRLSVARAAIAGLLVGSAFFGPLLSWIFHVGVVPWYILALGWLLLVLFETLFFVLFSVGAAVLGKWSFAGRLLFLPALWVSLEFIRSVGSWGFSWGMLALSQEALVILQLAKLTGPFGLSFLIVFVNVLLAEGFVRRSSGGRYASLVGLIILLGIGLANIGLELPSDSISRTVKVAVVQGNITQDAKFDPDFEDTIKKQYLSLTERALDTKAHLLIWPETAVPRPILDDKTFLARLQTLADSEGVFLLVGSFYRRPETGELHNSGFLISPEGDVERYDKRHLVPFGEYLPLRSVTSRIPALRVLGQDIAPGPRGGRIFSTERGRLAPVICFESTLTGVVRPAVTGGAQLLVVLTNDAWFDDSPALRQHLEQSRLRAVEYGIPVVQAANTGISGIIDSYGRILKTGPVDRPAVVVGELVISQPTTVYARVGDAIAYVCIVWTAVGLFTRLRRRPRKKLAYL